MVFCFNRIFHVKTNLLKWEGRKKKYRPRRQNFIHQDAESTEDTDPFKRYFYAPNETNLSTRYESDPQDIKYFT